MSHTRTGPGRPPRGPTMVTLVWGGGGPPMVYGHSNASPRGGGGSLGSKGFCTKRPDQIFPTVSFIPSHNGHFGREGGVQGVSPLPPTVYSRSNTSLRLRVQAHTITWTPDPQM